MAIFVNGCFWHRCPACSPGLPRTNTDFWARKFELNRERDARKQSELEKSGWTVLVIWECEVKQDPSASAERVIAALARTGSRLLQAQGVPRST